MILKLIFFFRLRCKRMRYTRILDASLHFLFVGLSVGSSVRPSVRHAFFFSNAQKRVFDFHRRGEGNRRGKMVVWGVEGRMGKGVTRGWQTHLRFGVTKLVLKHTLFFFCPAWMFSFLGRFSP